MKITKKQYAEKILDFANSDAITIAKKYGMKECVKLFEAALISVAVHEEGGNTSSASRILKTPVTTLSSRKVTLDKQVATMEKLIAKKKG